MGQKPTNITPAPIGNIEAEQAILGAVLIDNACFATVRESLRPESFIRATHRTIFRAYESLHAKSSPIDYLTVLNEVARLSIENRKKREREQVELVDVELDYLCDISERVPASSNVGMYVGIVRDVEARRTAQVIGLELKDRAATDSPAEIAAYLREQADDMTAKAQPPTAVPISAVIAKMIDAWRAEIAAFQSSGRAGIPTGIQTIDAKIHGLEPGKLYVIGARPSHGKTSLAAQMCMNAAVAGKAAGLFFTSEMSNLELAERMASCMAAVDLRRVKSGQASKEEYSRVGDAMEAIRSAPIWCDETPQISIERIAARTKNAVLRYGCKVVFVDYLQRLSSESVRRTYTREQEIAQISVALKSLARRHNIPVVVLAQFSRDVEKERTKRLPRLSDLRESGAIEQEADTAMLLWYGYKAGWMQPKPQFDVVLAKQRSGGTGNFQLRFIEEFCRFEDAPPEMSAHNDYQSEAPL